MFLFCSIYKTGTALLLQPWRLSFPCPSRRLGHGTNFKMHAGLVLQRADDAKQVEAIAIVADAEYGRGRRVGLAFRGGALQIYRGRGRRGRPPRRPCLRRRLAGIADDHGSTAGIKTIFRPGRNQPETRIDYRLPIGKWGRQND